MAEYYNIFIDCIKQERIIWNIGLKQVFNKESKIITHI